MEGTMTTIKIEGNKVFLKRKGSLNSEMIFEEGKSSYVPVSYTHLRVQNKEGKI